MLPGGSDPWRSGIEFQIDEIISCKGSEGIPFRVFAVTTKPFGLKVVKPVCIARKTCIISGEAEIKWLR